MHSGEGLQNQTMMIKVGSMNNPTGQMWDYKGKSDIVQIFISHTPDSRRIYSIQFLYVDNRELVMSQKFGDSIGDMFDAVKIDYPSEFITRMSGYKDSNSRNYYDNSEPSGYICSLTIGTNKGSYGPFGCPELQHNFKFQMGEADGFGGFHGSVVHDENNSTKTRIESIGVYVRPISSLSSLSSSSKIDKDMDFKLGKIKKERL